MSKPNSSLSSSQKQVHKSSECGQFPKRYYYLSKKQVACDVKLETDDGAIIYARKDDLAYACDYFHAMFTRFDEKDKYHVVLRELDSIALKLLIDYVYTKEIKITEENVKELLSTANYLGLHYVIHACCEFLQTHLRSTNCLSTRAFADLHCCSNLFSSSDEFIKKHLLEVIECDEFLSISSEEVIKLISYVEHTFSNDKKIVTCIINWINHELDCRKDVLAELLEYTNLSSALKLNIIQEVAKNPSTDNIIEKLGFNLFKLNLATDNVQKVILVFCWSALRSECFTEWYDPETKEWRLGPTINGCHMKSSLVVRNDCFVYALGNFSGTNPVYKLDLSSDLPSWVQTNSMLVNRSQFGVGVIDDWIYAVGGSNSICALNEVEAFDINVEEWEMVSSMSTRRSNVGVGVLNDLLYAVGGFDRLSNKYLKSVECYDPMVDTWTFIPHMNERRSNPGVGVLNGRMYVIGGHNGLIYHKSVEVYDPNVGLWTFIADMNVNRTNPDMGVVVLDGLLYVLGGRSALHDDISSVEIYDPNTNTWEHMVTTSSYIGQIYAGVVVNKLPHFRTN